MKRIALALALALSVPACSEEKKPEAAPAPKAAEPAKPAKPSGDVLALVGDRQVVKNQFDAEVAKIPEQHRTWTTTPQGRRHIVDNLVEGLLLESVANERGIDQRPEVVAKLEAYKRQIIRDELMKDLTKEQAQLSDADAEIYFNEHPAEFHRPERIKVLDLVVADEAAAKDALARLKKGGDFAQLAKELSTEPFTKERGGDLPEFSQQMRPELWAAAQGKKLGELVGPVQTSQGFHVMKLVNRLPAEDIAFAQAKESLKVRLQAIKRQQSYIDFVKAAKEKAQVQVNEEFIAGKAEAPEAPKSAEAPK